MLATVSFFLMAQSNTKAVELLLDEANGIPHRKRRLKVEVQLVERGTVGPPRAHR